MPSASDLVVPLEGRERVFEGPDLLADGLGIDALIFLKGRGDESERPAALFDGLSDNPQWAGEGISVADPFPLTASVSVGVRVRRVDSQAETSISPSSLAPLRIPRPLR